MSIKQMIFEFENEVDNSELEKIIKVVEEVKSDMNMDGWTVSVEYSPDEYEDSAAEVRYTIHREACINVYRYNPNTIYKDIAHELGHCKIGKITDAQKSIIETQRTIIDHFLQRYEEEVIDDVVDIIYETPKVFPGDILE